MGCNKCCWGRCFSNNAYWLWPYGVPRQHIAWDCLNKGWNYQRGWLCSPCPAGAWGCQRVNPKGCWSRRRCCAWGRWVLSGIKGSCSWWSVTYYSRNSWHLRWNFLAITWSPSSSKCSIGFGCSWSLLWRSTARYWCSARWFCSSNVAWALWSSPSRSHSDFRCRT